MPYKSRAQAAYFNIHRKELEAQGVDVGEWNRASKGMHLPKHKQDGGSLAEQDSLLSPMAEINRQFATPPIQRQGSLVDNWRRSENVEDIRDRPRLLRYLPTPSDIGEGLQRLYEHPLTRPGEEMPENIGQLSQEAGFSDIPKADGGEVDEGESWTPSPEPLEAGYPEPATTARDIAAQQARERVQPSRPIPRQEGTGEESVTSRPLSYQEKFQQFLEGEHPGYYRKRMAENLAEIAGGVLPPLAAEHAYQHEGLQAAAIAGMPGIGKLGKAAEKAGEHGVEKAVKDVFAKSPGTYQFKGDPFKPAAPEPAPLGKPPSNPNYDLHPLDVQAMKQVGGNKGTGEGGQFLDPQGDKWYIKTQHDPDLANNEKLAAELYRRAGVNVADTRLTELNGKPAIASRMIPDVKQLSDYPYVNGNGLRGLHEGFPADVWLANGDTIGAGMENPRGNILYDKHNNAYRIDFGGAMRFGGLGGLKSWWGPKVNEFETFVGPNNKNTTMNSVFSLTSPEIKAGQKDVAQNIANISNGEIAELVSKYGPTDGEEKIKLLNTLISRRNQVAHQYDVKPGGGGPVPSPGQEHIDALAQHLQSEPKPDFGHSIPEDDFSESMDAMGKLAKTSGEKPLTPMQLKKTHQPEDYINALGGQSYLSALGKKAVTTKQGDNILKNFQNMDQDKLAKALSTLPVEKMTNVATWAKPGTIKKIWEAQHKTPLSEVFGVEPKSIAQSIIDKSQGDSQQMAEMLYATAQKNPELADAVNKLLPTNNMEDVANHMNFLIGKHGDPWGGTPSGAPKHPLKKGYTEDDVAEYWDKVDQKLKDDWEIAQGGTDFKKNLGKVYSSPFDKFFQPLSGKEWLDYRPKEATKQKTAAMYAKQSPLNFLHKTPEQLRKLGVNPDVPIYKGGPNYPAGKYPEKMKDPSTKYSEKAWFAGALHYIGGSYGGHTNVNPYVYGGKDIKVAKLNWKDAHHGDASYAGGDMDGVIEAARARGFDMVILEDMADVGSHTAGLHTQFAFLNTKGLRAPHAYFNPDFLSMANPNPLWGLVGGGLFGYGMLKGQEKDESKMARGGQIMPFKPIRRASGGFNPIESGALHGEMYKLSRMGMINSSIPGRTDKIPMKVPAGSYVLPADIPSALGQGNTMAGGQILKKMFSSGPYGIPTMKSRGSRPSMPRIQQQKMPKGMFADGGDVEEMFEKANQQSKQKHEDEYRHHRMMNPNMFMAARGYDPHSDQDLEQRSAPLGGSDIPEGPEGQDLASGGGGEHVPIIAAGGEYIIHPDVVRDIGHGNMKHGHSVLDKFVLRVRREHIKTLKGLPAPKK